MFQFLHLLHWLLRSSSLGVTISAEGIIICAITAGIKKYKSIITKKKNENL